MTDAGLFILGAIALFCTGHWIGGVICVLLILSACS